MMLRQFLNVTCRNVYSSVSLTRNLKQVCAPSCYYATVTEEVAIEAEPKKQMTKPYKKRPSDELKSVDIKDIAALWDSPGSFHKVEILQLLSSKFMSDESKTLDSTVLQEFSKSVAAETARLKDNELVAALRLFVSISSEDNEQITTLLKAVQWRTNKFTYGNLQQLEDLLKKHQETELRRSLLKEVQTELKQILDIKRPIKASDALTMLYMLSEIKAEDCNEPREKRFKLIENAIQSNILAFNQNQLFKIFYLLGKNRRRNKLLLQCITDHLKLANRKDLTLIKLANITYSAAVLNFYNVEFLTKLTASLLGQLEFVRKEQVMVLPQLLVSCSHLKWRHEDLVNTIVKKWMSLRNFKNSQHGVKPEFMKEALSIFSSLTSLNLAAMFVPNLKRTVIADAVVNMYYKSDPVLWLNYATNCALQNQLSAEMANLTLEPSFVKHCIDSVDGIKLHSRHLLTVNAAATYSLPHYTGHLLDEATRTACIDTLKSLPHRESTMHSILDATLGLIVPSTKYMRKYCYSPHGQYFDFQLEVNSKGELIPITDSADANRIAVQLLDFHDLTLCTETVSPQVASNQLLLSKQGYKVIQIHHEEFLSFTKDIERIKNIEMKLKETVSP